MKKILFSLSAMVILLQFSCIAEASPDKYILQEAPVSFKGMQEQTVKDINQEETTLETKQILQTPEEEEQQDEIQNVKQDTQYSQKEEPTGEEKPTVQTEPTTENPTVRTEQEVNESEKQEILQKEDKNIKQSAPEAVTEEQQQSAQNENNLSEEQIIAIFDKSLDNVELALNETEMISLSGLLLMQKTIYQNSPKIEEYEKRFVEINKQEDPSEKENIIADLKREIVASIEKKLQKFDFSSLSREEKVQWGKGTYILKIANNRFENIANNLSPFYKMILDEKLSENNCIPQLERAGKIMQTIEIDAVTKNSLFYEMDKINAENQIVISIPEKEAIVLNPNGIFYKTAKETKDITTLLEDGYKQVIEEFNFEKFVEAEKDANFNKLPEVEKAENMQFAIINGITKGLEEIAEKQRTDADFQLTEAQAISCKNLANVFALANKEYPNLLKDSQELIDTIEKNKTLKDSLSYTVVKIRNNSMKINQDMENFKGLQSSVMQICELFKIN